VSGGPGNAYEPRNERVGPSGSSYHRDVARVLVVEDDDTVASVLAGYLTRAGHAPEVVADGKAALDRLERAPADLVVLDIMLPGMNGLDVCRAIRRSDRDLPIVMLTALGEPEDRIAGLEVGADDYVAKPFSPRELVLRIDSVLRRASRVSTALPTVLSAGGVTVDTAARTVFRDGVELALTVREFDLLAFLMANPGVAFRRSDLMREVWGWTFGDDSTVTVHVRRLREKIEPDATTPTIIHTVWGVGYRLEAA
jgi:two-component system, OmpR family, response regulator ResD